ncbi:MAG TPA: hypothetical protein VMH27_23190 [Puia sp.]|nr:hypothetical protein [Puia sp.]
MLRRPRFAVIFVSGYLLVYTVFLAVGNPLLTDIAIVQLFFSPLLVTWMAYTIVRYGKYREELNDNRSEPRGWLPLRD